MLLQILVAIVVLWVIYAYLLPLLPEKIRVPVQIVLVVIVIVWLLRLAGLGF